MPDKMIRSLVIMLALLAPTTGQAIDVGDMTFSMPAESAMVSKNVGNNNKQARLYRVKVRRSIRPGEHAITRPAADGELVFTSRTITLPPQGHRGFNCCSSGPADANIGC